LRDDHRDDRDGTPERSDQDDQIPLCLPLRSFDGTRVAQQHQIADPAGSAVHRVHADVHGTALDVCSMESARATVCCAWLQLSDAGNRTVRASSSTVGRAQAGRQQPLVLRRAVSSACKRAFFGPSAPGRSCPPAHR